MSNTPADRKPRKVTIDGNTAAAHVAHAVSEVIAIYPITPSSVMGEISDEKSARGEKNIWGTVPTVVEMQSEGGAAGAVHGSLQAGAMTTTFTASQGLLLMIPNMYKIAGELTPAVFHVSARALAAQGLSIFGDHSDVMSTRATGFAMLCAGSVQETMDLALVAHSATLAARIPFLHFFDGFRTSHEVQKVEELSQGDMRHMIDDALVREFRARALTPDRPTIRGTAQNPDVYFQGRETPNRFYDACPGLVQATMDKFAKLTGRAYRLFDYVGAPDAERVIVMMGSGAEVAHELVEHMAAKGEKVGLVKVRLYRPFGVEAFVKALPKSVRSIAVLDRTKEPGAGGEPLYLDIQGALMEMAAEGKTPFATLPRVVGGRYGLGSKEFTPAMVKAVYDNLSQAKPRNHFVVGIEDDVTGSSIAFDPTFSVEPEGTFRGLFFGLGADGTVGASKNSIKIIGQETDNFAQGYFVYDSKKSGSMTVSHLRFGKQPIRSSYLIDGANFVACHQFVFLEKVDILRQALPGGTFLLNSHFGPNEVWDRLPRLVQERIVERKLKLHVIDAWHVARETGMGGRINTIMQTCFFAISGILPREEAIQKIKDSIKKTYGMRGDKVVEQNWEAVDATLANLHEVKVPSTVTSQIQMQPAVSKNAPAFVKEVTAKMIEGKGDAIRVSQMPVDGVWPVSTSQWEKRAIALEVPVWDEKLCIQCGKCAIVCPHAAIRCKAYPAESLAKAPKTFKSIEFKERDFANWRYTIQSFVEDCTGCGICEEVCPAKDKANPEKKALVMADPEPLRAPEGENAEFFLGLPELDRSKVKQETVKGSQLLEPLFEFSGACGGCGETPYVKLVTQLFGDRALIANATGCSSIYGGNLPTTPYCANKAGRGPAWANSLFEDNAEFGFGMRLAIDKMAEEAREILPVILKDHPALVDAMLKAEQTNEAAIFEQRVRIEEAKRLLVKAVHPGAARLMDLIDYLAKKSVWIFGGDGWAYDIGYGGLDHVLAQNRNVNVLVMDTEVYSNTGGQMSKATPSGAVAKFAAGGKPMGKKDLGLIAMSYGHIYVATVALGSSDLQTVRAFMEAEAYDGPSLVIAYSHCIAHGIEMKTGLQNQDRAVKSGHWPLYRYNPALAAKGENPLKLDSKPPKISLEEFESQEARFLMLQKADPERAKRLIGMASAAVAKKWALLNHLAALDYKTGA